MELNKLQLQELYEAIKDNITVGYIKWHRSQSGYSSIESIDQKLAENNRSYRYYSNDYVHALLSKHAYRSSKEKDTIILGASIDKYLKDWKVEKVYDDTDTTGYYGAVYINDKTHQVILASRGSESIIKGLFSKNSDWKTNLEEIVGGKIIPGQQAWNYLATEEAVKLVKEKGYHLSLTGHSLGAWLAELGAFYCHAYFNHPDVKAVTFDSPGSYQMMKRLKSNIQNRGTKVNIKDIEIVTYLAAPNPVNSCNQHVGRVYRVNREMDVTKWIDSKVSTFIMNLFGDKIHGALSLEGHMLAGILATFNLETGKPKQNSCIRIADWPRLQYHGEEKINDTTVSGTTIMSFISLFVNIVKGEIYQGEYWEYFKHIDLKDAEGKSEPKYDLSFDNRFSLVAKAHYREDDKNILKLSKGSIDELLYDLHHFKKRLDTFGDFPEIMREQLIDLASSFEVKAIDREGKKYELIPIKEEELDVDGIKQRMIRLIEVIPGGKKKLKGFFQRLWARDCS